MEKTRKLLDILASDEWELIEDEQLPTKPKKLPFDPATCDFA